MKINQRKISAVLLSLMIFLPTIAFAAGFIPTDAQINGYYDASGKFIAGNGFCAFAGMINTILKWFIDMSVAVAAITFSIAGGKMLLNPENASKRTEAIEMFKKTVVGLLIVLGAWLAIHTVITILVPNSTGSTGALRFLDNNCPVVSSQ